MGWVFLKTGQLPLGARALDYGMKGADVQELQVLLKTAGFYGARIDGVYGALTREAVLLVQKTFALKTDGIAGRQVIKELSNTSGGGASGWVGRIIYTVKTGDSLEKISRKFNVHPAAWRGLLHKGTTLKKIYPGMKLLLREKAVFAWDPAPDSHSKSSFNPSLTGQIKTGWRLDLEGNLSPETPESPPHSSYYLLQADPPTWEKVLIQRRLRRKLAIQLQGLGHLNFGLDLRQAPLSTSLYWASYAKFIARQNPRRKNVKFLVLPLINPGSGAARGFWANLTELGRYAQFLMLEPELNFDTPLTFLLTGRQSRSNLRRLVQLGISHQCMVVGEAGAWDWDLEDNCYQPISLKKARLIREMFPREVEYDLESQYTIIYYTHRSRRHCLIYRDDQGWDDFFKLLNRFNFYGTVIREFQRLGEKGLQLMADSFAILPPH